MTEGGVVMQGARNALVVKRNVKIARRIVAGFEKHDLIEGVPKPLTGGEIELSIWHDRTKGHDSDLSVSVSVDGPPTPD